MTSVNSENGMVANSDSLASAQAVMLEILQEFHRVCTKNNLTYWLEGGTLLGAIRHRGFIPWDDDVDVAMPVRDYQRLCSIAKSEFGTSFFLQTSSTDPNYPKTIPKIRKHGTLLLEYSETGKEDYHHGIFIDVFPFVSYKYEWFVNLMRWSMLLRERKHKYIKGTWKRTLVTIYTQYLMMPLLLPVKLLRFFYQKTHDAALDRDDYPYFSHKLGCTWVCNTKRNDILPVKLGKGIFEGKDFYIPNNPDGYLKACYGKDYMVLPPVDERKTHAKYFSVKSSL